MIKTTPYRNVLVRKLGYSTRLENFKYAMTRNTMHGKTAIAGFRSWASSSQCVAFSTVTICRQKKEGNTANEAFDGPVTPPPTNIKFPEIISMKKLTKEQLKKVQDAKRQQEELAKKYTAKQKEEIELTGSKYYQPKNPLGSSKNRELIEQRIASIQKRLEKQGRLHAAELQRLKKKQLEAEKPQLSDFKRPISACFLLAVSIFMGLEYAWYSLEGEENVIHKEEQTRIYEEKIQELLNEQKRVVEDNKSGDERKGFWNKLVAYWKI